MNRRGFLGSILAACAAPAIVRADSLMRVVPTETVIAFPPYSMTVVMEEFDANYSIAGALEVAHRNMAFVKSVNRQYDDAFMKPGKAGDRLIIRAPNRYTQRSA